MGFFCKKRLKFNIFLQKHIAETKKLVYNDYDKIISRILKKRKKHTKELYQ